MILNRQQTLSMFLLFSLMSFSNLILSQDIPELYNAKRIFWYGLDFSHAKMIGSVGFKDVDVIANSYIHPKWNDIVFNQSHKFNIHEMCGKKGVINYRDAIIESNRQVTTFNLVIDSDYSISKKSLIGIMNDYKTFKDDHIGLVFIVESFNKLENRSYVWVVYFNIKSGKILNAIKYEGKPAGAGVLNYWANSISSIIQQAKKDYKKLVSFSYSTN